MQPVVPWTISGGGCSDGVGDKGSVIRGGYLVHSFQNNQT